MSILKDWYDGHIYPSEEINPNSPEYCALEEKIQQEQDYFSKQFSTAEKERFEQFTTLIYEQSDLFAFASFAYALKLGLLLMYELMAGGNGPET